MEEASLLQGFYDRIHYAADGDSRKIQIIGTFVAGTLAYILANAPFVALDLLDPAWVSKFRVQDGGGKKVTLERWLSALPRILFNLIVVNGLMDVVLYLTGRLNTSRELPTFTTALWQLVAFVVVEEFGFYYSHRALHHKSVYKHVHKIHHEWTAPVSITSVYAHPLEHVASNLIPVFLGPLILGSHVTVVWLWLSIALWSTTCVHSGYHLPLTPSSEFHDYHHLAFNECFGVLGFLDWAHDTSKTFRNSVRGVRHYTLWSPWTTMKELHPDTAKCDKNGNAAKDD